MHFTFLDEIWGEGGGGGMNLVYGSSSSSYMDCMVFFGGECFIFRRSGVRKPRAPAFAPPSWGLIIFGSSFCGSHTFRMSTRRLPGILFVSRIEYPFISCCLLCGVTVVAGGGFYFVCLLSHVSNLRLIIVFCSSSSSCRLRGLSACLTAHDMLRFIQSTIMVLTLAIFIQWH